MRQTKRKFVALSTALAMALVLVASLVPTTVAQALTGGPTYIINEVAFDFTSPKAGDSVSLGGEDGDEPSMTTAISTSTVGIKHSASDPVPLPGGFFVKDSINSVEDYQDGDPEDSFFVGKFESGKTYKAVVGAEADIDNGYALADDVNVTVNGATVVDKKIENTASGHNGVLILISFKVGGGESGGGGTDPSEDPTVDPQTPTSDVTTIENGGSATLNPAADGTVSFRIERNFADFQKGGKLYVDGFLVPIDQYYATPGSTIITFVKEYAAKLADGLDHAVKVVFAKGEEFNATIKVSPASSDGTAANGTSGTASSTAATTTKVTSPKTADVLPIAGIALVFVGATAIGVIAIRRKNS